MNCKNVLLLVLVTMITSIFAFDGKHQGFIVGIGVGYSPVLYKTEIENTQGSFESDVKFANGFATNTLVGYGFSNRLEAFITNKNVWYERDKFNQRSSDDFIINFLSATGITYFLSKELDYQTWAPSPYISAGIGRLDWIDFFGESHGNKGRLGFFVGVGYEFVEHLRLSLDYYSNTKETSSDNGDKTRYSHSFILSLNAFVY